MNINLNLKIGGSYTLYKHKKGEKPKKVAEFDNLITNTGLANFTSSAGWGSSGGSGSGYIRIGSGNTEPDFTDTSLDSQLRASASIQWGRTLVNDESGRYASSMLSYQFAPTGSAYTVRELGVSGTSSSSLWSRSLLKKSDGSTTDLSVLGDEYLTVRYVLRKNYWNSDANPVFTFTPSSGEDTAQRTVTVSLEEAKASSAFHIGYPGSSYTLPGSPGSIQRVSENTIRLTSNIIPPGTNTGNISRVTIMGIYYFDFTPAFNKTADHQFQYSATITVDRL